MPKLSEEQIRQARSVDLLDYLLTYEPSNVRKSKGRAGQHEMVEHDSLKISNGKWFRHSTQYGGYSALDFLMKVRGVHFVDAVQSLTSGYAITEYKAERKAPIKPPAPPKSFTLPKPNRNADRVVAYLRGRGIGRDVIYRCIKAGLLYESNKHRCVFVGKDEDGKARFACERGITEDLKKDVSGSNKQFSFSIPPIELNGHGGSALALFESPIDCMAHASIHDMGQTGWDGYRLSLGGVSSAALNGFLERNPQITSIQLCLDNDKAGHDATNRIITELLSDKRYSHIKITTAPPPIGKDYADTVLAIKQNSINKSTIDRPKEAAFSF
ncbi:MAG: DUF3991 and toprim domain-containing protein [Oscillospiraceae bacterium]|nr:DUF3991 and toprim domain-containing protein [Oscillospiraceae bacterium]